MLGACSMVGGKDFLSFKIRGSKLVTHIKITLLSDDTCRMDFYKIRGGNIKIVRVFEGIYCDQLRNVIRDITGLSTNL